MYVVAIPPQHNQIFSSLFQNIEENVQKGEEKCQFCPFVLFVTLEVLYQWVIVAFIASCS